FPSRPNECANLKEEERFSGLPPIITQAESSQILLAAPFCSSIKSFESPIVFPSLQEVISKTGAPAQGKSCNFRGVPGTPLHGGGWNSRPLSTVQFSFRVKRPK